MYNEISLSFIIITIVRLSLAMAFVPNRTAYSHTECISFQGRESDWDREWSARKTCCSTIYRILCCLSLVAMTSTRDFVLLVVVQWPDPIWCAVGGTLNRNKNIKSAGGKACDQTKCNNNNIDENQSSPIKLRRVQSLWRALSSSAFIEQGERGRGRREERGTVL